MRLPGRYYRIKFSTVNALRDWWDTRIKGTCCAAPERGGYRFWRCGRRSGHAGPHRFNNYTWREGEQAAYDPIDAVTREMGVDWPRNLRRYP